MRLGEIYHFHNVIAYVVELVVAAVLSAILVSGVTFWCFCCHRNRPASTREVDGSSDNNGGAIPLATTGTVTTAAHSGPSPAANVPTSSPTAASFVSLTPEQFAQLLGKLDEVVVGNRSGESGDTQPRQRHPYRYELFRLKRTTVMIVLYSAEDTTQGHLLTTTAAAAAEGPEGTIFVSIGHWRAKECSPSMTKQTQAKFSLEHGGETFVTQIWKTCLSVIHA